jgi:hypothetical protein
MTSDENGPDRTESTSPEAQRTAIGARTATILYLLIAIAAIVLLKGKPLLLALIIVFGLAAKSYVHYRRQKHESG